MQPALLNIPDSNQIRLLPFHALDYPIVGPFFGWSLSFTFYFFASLAALM